MSLAGKGRLAQPEEITSGWRFSPATGRAI